MLTDRHTDGRTDDGRKVVTIAHPEHSSGELKMTIKIALLDSVILPFHFWIKLSLNLVLNSDKTCSCFQHLGLTTHHKILRKTITL